MKKRVLASIVLLIGMIVVSGCGCKQSNPKQYTLDLEVWGLFDDSDAYKDIIDSYKAINPNIGQINYRKLGEDTYKKDLIDAMASDQGPDIFLVHNNWIPSLTSKIYPAPAEVLNEQKFRNDFVDVAGQDFISQGFVMAVPLSVDSLGLYYNKDLFNAAGITSPPKTWDEFVADAVKLTKINTNGQIVQSGAAMGTMSNINRTTDVLNLLMLQNKTEMISADGKSANFNGYIAQGDGSFSPGTNAVDFYTQFANRGSDKYTWNSMMHYSIDAFSEGTLGMMFNYSWQMATITSKSPKLNYAVSPVPQFPNNPQVNFANYWAYTVAKKRTPGLRVANPAVTNDVRAAEAWKFLSFLTTKPETAFVASVGSKQKIDPNFDPAIDYINKTNKPAARRDLIEKQKTDAQIGVFAQGNLIAKDWYQIDPDSIEKLFLQMIDQINKGQISVGDALKNATVSVTQMMRQF